MPMLRLPMLRRTLAMTPAVTLAVLVLACLLPPLPVQAQPSTTIVSLPCLLCETRVSADGTLAAVFENRNMVGDAAPPPAVLAITLIDTKTGRQVGTLRGQTDFAADAAFSPDGKWLASLHTNGVLRLWDVKTRKLVWERLVNVGGGRLAFAPDGKTIVLQLPGVVGMFALVDRGTGVIDRLIGPRFKTMTEFQDRISEPLGTLDFTLSAWAIAPDGNQIAAATANDEVGLWDVATGSYSRLRPAGDKKGLFNIRQLGYLPDGKSIYFSFRDPNQPEVWSLATQTDTLKLPADLTFGQSGLVLSPDGKHFAAAEGTSAAKIVLAPVEDLGAVTTVAEVPEGLRPVPNTRLFFTPDGKTIIAGGFAAPDGDNAILIVKLE